MLFSSVNRENITWKLIKLEQKIIFQYLFQKNIIIQLYIYSDVGKNLQLITLSVLLPRQQHRLVKHGQGHSVI